MSKLSPLAYRVLIKKLESFGIKVMKSRGKGSEVILLIPIQPGSTKGPQYPMTHHSDNHEIAIGTISAILRRFNINRNDFLKA